MNLSNTMYSFLTLALSGAVLALLIRFASRFSKDFKSESDAITLELEKNRGLLEAGKITTRDHQAWTRAPRMGSRPPALRKMTVLERFLALEQIQLARDAVSHVAINAVEVR